MKKRVFGLVLGLVISALFLWATLHRVDLDAVAKAATGASLPVLSLCVVMRTFGFLFMAARTRTLPVGDVEFPTKDARLNPV